MRWKAQNLQSPSLCIAVGLAAMACVVLIAEPGCAEPKVHLQVNGTPSVTMMTIDGKKIELTAPEYRCLMQVPEHQFDISWQGKPHSGTTHIEVPGNGAALYIDRESGLLVPAYGAMVIGEKTF